MKFAIQSFSDRKFSTQRSFINLIDIIDAIDNIATIYYSSNQFMFNSASLVK